MPRYKDLPDFGLYMDQVVSYVNKSLNVFEEDGASLMNKYNYLSEHRVDNLIARYKQFV